MKWASLLQSSPCSSGCTRGHVVNVSADVTTLAVWVVHDEVTTRCVSGGARNKSG